jgi:hypothetical protein
MGERDKSTTVMSSSGAFTTSSRQDVLEAWESSTTH